VEPQEADARGLFESRSNYDRMNALDQLLEARLALSDKIRRLLAEIDAKEIESSKKVNDDGFKLDEAWGRWFETVDGSTVLKSDRNVVIDGPKSVATYDIESNSKNSDEEGEAKAFSSFDENDDDDEPPLKRRRTDI